MPPWKLAEANLGQIKGECYEVAVLPLGAGALAAGTGIVLFLKL